MSIEFSHGSHGGGCFQIFGYPKDIFPPTDFHSATFFNGQIYIVGGLRYQGSRLPGITPIYRLDCQSWKIETFAASGDQPGWIFQHSAQVNESGVLIISGGKICIEANGEPSIADNEREFALDLHRGIWSPMER